MDRESEINMYKGRNWRRDILELEVLKFMNNLNVDLEVEIWNWWDNRNKIVKES